MARFGSPEGPDNPGSDPTQSIRYRQSGPPPPGPPPAPLGPAGPGGQGYRPTDAPTQYGAAYNPFEQQEPPPPDVPNFSGQPPTPWFRRKPVLIAWIGLIAVMLALVIWGIVQLTSRGPGGNTTPAPSSSSTTSATSTTSTTSATTTTSTSASPAPSTAPPPRQAPPKQPPAQQTPAPTEPSHRHRLPSLPSVITIPPIPKVPELPTVITIPPYR